MLSRATPWLLVPVKSLHAGKQRLRAVLSDEQRLNLNHFLLSRTLEVASAFPGLGRTAVVSDAEDVLTLARSKGARAIHTPRQELNGALADGCGVLFRDQAPAIMVLPVDLPAIQSSDLEEIASAGRRSDMVLCPDRHAIGTNGMYISSNHIPNFYFGVDSFRLHQREAHRWDITLKLLFNRNIAFDVDHPADLELLEESI